MAVLSDIKYKYNTAGMVMKIIYINIAVFLVLRIAGIFCFFGDIDPIIFLSWIELPSSFAMLATRPWTIITYMFAHYDIFHILLNMLVLYWFGKIFMDFFSPKHFCGLYILGGIGGGLLYMIAYQLLPGLDNHSGWLIGASASIMAIVLATAVRAPQYSLNLLFFGPVHLKWIAIFYVAIDLLSIDGANMGGHISHLGGAMTGVLFTLLLNKGIDFTAPINAVIDLFTSIGRPKNPFARKKVKINNNKKQPSSRPDTTSGMSKEDENTLDIILDKIKKSGYTSLTEDEKRRLFQVSNKR